MVIGSSKRDWTVGDPDRSQNSLHT